MGFIQRAVKFRRLRTSRAKARSFQTWGSWASASGNRLNVLWSPTLLQTSARGGKLSYDVWKRRSHPLRSRLQKIARASQERTTRTSAAAPRAIAVALLVYVDLFDRTRIQYFYKTCGQRERV